MYICEKLVGTGGGGYHSSKCDLDIWCALLKIFFFQYNEIISTSKLPFHNPLVMKYYKVLAFFSLDYENCPFTKFSW